MKVICIDSKDNGYGDCNELVEGNEYIVTDSWIGRYSQNPYYSLLGFNCIRGERGYQQYRFIPLSEIDELELVNEKEIKYT